MMNVAEDVIERVVCSEWAFSCGGPNGQCTRAE